MCSFHLGFRPSELSGTVLCAGEVAGGMCEDVGVCVSVFMVTFKTE